jgi:hypothetical protein
LLFRWKVWVLVQQRHEEALRQGKSKAMPEALDSVTYMKTGTV